MEDVIFAGSEGLAPVGMAEVTLTFDNSDGTAPPAFAAYAEIQISRRLFRTGESEYLLNRTPCRLRDVQDFFRDTGIGTKGYTIVEQGKIAEIVSAKPEERRSLIEEAAGIGKYKARRREAETKIEATEQNLLRVNDILTEIRRQISSIERQAKKAARYKRLRETLRVLELSLAADDRRELAHGDRCGPRPSSSASATPRPRARRSSPSASSRVQAKRLELGECERILTQGSEALLALRGDIKECEGQIEYGRRERESLAALVETRGGELAELPRAARGARPRRRPGRGGARLRRAGRGVGGRVAGAGPSPRCARRARVSTRSRASARLANTALVNVLTAIARAEDRLAAVEDRRAELEARLRNADEVLELGQGEASRADREQHDLEEGLRNLLAERDRMMNAVRGALESYDAAVTAESAADDALRAVREEVERKRARLVSLREVLQRGEDVAAGTRHLLERDAATRNRLGLRGLVRDFIEADRDVERAVEAALADRAEALVVDAPAGAVSALELLHAGRAGRAVFVTTPPRAPETGLRSARRPAARPRAPARGPRGSAARTARRGVSRRGARRGAARLRRAGAFRPRSSLRTATCSRRTA